MTTGLNNENIGKLLGLLAHDLRNPLSALHSNIGFLETIDGLDEDAREAIGDGMVSCDGLAHIIDNVELLGQRLREASIQRPRPAAMGLAQAASDTVQSCAAAAQSHEVELVIADTLRATDVNVLCDRDMFRKSLGNLVRNSIQLGGSGPIRLSFRSDDRHAVVVVEDHGPNPRGDLREAVFTVDGQIRAKTEAAGRYSRGLGLLCARLAADACGGEVKVVDPPSGQGNAFELRVPHT